MARDGQSGSGSSTRPIPYARQSISAEDEIAVLEALRSDYVTQGPRQHWFEDALREVTGARHAVVVSSGTAALHLVCQSIGLGPSDMGIVPAITFVATANAARYTGAQVRFADVDGENGLSMPEHLERAVELAGGRAKALLPVSLAGRVPDLQGIGSLAQREGCFVIEDASHSLGAMGSDGKGQPYASGSCAHADAATLSFHPVKHVCAGEGGAILTNDATLARRSRSLRSHGVERGEELSKREGGWAYEQTELGWNYRMTELQAALGMSQLKRLPAFLDRRRAIARRYEEAFGAARFGGLLARPTWDRGMAWHLYVVRFASSEMRRCAYESLQKQGIQTQVHYRPLYRNPYYGAHGSAGLPGAETYYQGCLSLPMYPSLEDSEQERVIECLEGFCGQWQQE